MNLYALIKNDPVNAIDSHGLMNPFVFQLLSNCAKTIIFDYALKHIKKDFNEAQTCSLIGSDIKYNGHDDCMADYEVPKRIAPIKSQESLTKSIKNCLISSARNGALDKLIDHGFTKKMIEKLVGDDDSLTETLKNLSIEPKLKIKYTCNSESSVSYDTYSDIKIASAGINFEIKQKIMSGTCKGPNRKNSTIRAMCKKCCYE